MTKQKQQRKKKAIKKMLFNASKRFVIIGNVLLVLIFLLGFGFYIYLSKSSTPKQFPETEKNVMKHIPPDVKKEIAKQAQTASISATLQLPILLYHYVEYVRDKRDTIRQSLNVNPNVFEQQIQILLTAGYTFITSKDLGDILEGAKPVPQKPIILTFDDGHWDLDTNVLPILKKYNIHATAYIVPGFIGGSDFLSSSQLQDVVNSGLIDVGAHTVHHTALKGLPLSRVEEEVNDSKTMLEQQYHIQVYSFAYPYGSFDQQTINVVKQAGFTTAASTIGGAQQNYLNRLFLYRVRPGYQTGQRLLTYLEYWEQHINKISYLE